jgi:hypothetical protein
MPIAFFNIVVVYFLFHFFICCCIIRPCDETLLLWLPIILCVFVIVLLLVLLNLSRHKDCETNGTKIRHLLSTCRYLWLLIHKDQLFPLSLCFVLQCVIISNSGSVSYNIKSIGIYDNNRPSSSWSSIGPNKDINTTAPLPASWVGGLSSVISLPSQYLDINLSLALSDIMLVPR